MTASQQARCAVATGTESLDSRSRAVERASEDLASTKSFVSNDLEAALRMGEDSRLAAVIGALNRDRDVSLAMLVAPAIFQMLDDPESGGEEARAAQQRTLTIAMRRKGDAIEDKNIVKLLEARIDERNGQKRIIDRQLVALRRRGDALNAGVEVVMTRRQVGQHLD